MGACTFYSEARRGGMSGPLEEYEPHHWRSTKIDWPNAETAFDHLGEEDRYENGHSYSGGIGMKLGFVHIATVETDDEASALAQKLIEDSDPRINDKWGPAGCITVRNGEIQFLFFGWASS